jgi:hypothetical protein
MKPNVALRWLGVLVAIPTGAFIGFLAAYYVCLGVLYLQGKGHSHNDMFTVVTAGMLGLPAGALLLPFFVWLFTRVRQS